MHASSPDVVGVDDRPGRVNPHVDTARAHTTAWATAMGMVGPRRDPERLVVWDRATFDEMRIGEFAAYAHPDAPADVLPLVTDWLVLLWYVDDAADLIHQRDGEAAARRFLADVAARGPDTATPAARPRTAHPDPHPHGAGTPADRAAADLWSRTAGRWPDRWCRRFHRSIAECTDEMAVAIAHNQAGRMPDPIGYVEARRGFGGMGYAADLVEVALGAVMDDDLVAARPVRQLRATFADAVALRNDVWSYRKEVVAGEAPSNAVAVLQAFLGCDPFTAARLVGDLQRARRRWFEHVAAHDVPQLDAAARAQVEGYAEALRDWMAGDLRWAAESGRYRRPTAAERRLLPLLPTGPTGLGTSAARPDPA